MEPDLQAARNLEKPPVEESSCGVGVPELVTGSLRAASSVDAAAPPVGPAGYDEAATPAMAASNESRLERPHQEETANPWLRSQLVMNHFP